MAGYAKIATLMGAYPEVAIIRRFAALNMQNVLYLQAELVNLEARLRKYEEEDRDSGDQTRVDYALNWFKLRNATDFSKSPYSLLETCTRPMSIGHEKVDEELEQSPHGRRWRLILRIREKLKEYCAAADGSLLVFGYSNVRS